MIEDKNNLALDSIIENIDSKTVEEPTNSWLELFLDMTIPPIVFFITFYTATYLINFDMSTGIYPFGLTNLVDSFKEFYLIF